MKRAHKDLHVWSESMNLATEIYKQTERFPKSEIYGLTSQMRRAAISIPSNIAGGSLSELDTQIEIAANLGFLSENIKQKLDQEVSAIAAKLAGLLKKVRKVRNSE